MNGLLGMGQQGAQMGGLLGGGMPQNMPQAPQGNGMQMAMALYQNPTQEVADGIIAQLKASQNPDAAQLEQIIGAAGGDPEKLKMIAEKVMELMSSK